MSICDLIHTEEEWFEWRKNDWLEKENKKAIKQATMLALNM